jgi:hypothetical protein
LVEKEAATLVYCLVDLKADQMDWTMAAKMVGL